MSAAPRRKAKNGIRPRSSVPRRPRRARPGCVPASSSAAPERSIARCRAGTNGCDRAPPICPTSPWRTSGCRRRRQTPSPLISVRPNWTPWPRTPIRPAKISRNVAEEALIARGSRRSARNGEPMHGAALAQARSRSARSRWRRAGPPAPRPGREHCLPAAAADELRAGSGAAIGTMLKTMVISRPAPAPPARTERSRTIQCTDHRAVDMRSLARRAGRPRRPEQLIAATTRTG